MRFLRLLPFLALVVLAAACGDGDTEPTSGDTATPSTSEQSTTEPSTTGSTTDSSSAGSQTTETPSDGPTTSSDDGPTTTSMGGGTGSSATGDDDGQPSDTAGTVNVSLEPIDGFFIEGFEIGLRFETPDQEVLASFLWTDVVAALDDPTIEDYYDTVHPQPVTAGEVVVLATVSIGVGPAPVTPDLDGPMQCRLVVEVPEGGEVDVEVSFEQSNCLALR